MLADGGCADRLGYHWKLNHEPGADGLVLLHANGTVVVFNYAAYDG